MAGPLMLVRLPLRLPLCPCSQAHATKGRLIAGLRCCTSEDLPKHPLQSLLQRLDHDFGPYSSRPARSVAEETIHFRALGFSAQNQASPGRQGSRSTQHFATSSRKGDTPHSLPPPVGSPGWCCPPADAAGSQGQIDLRPCGQHVQGLGLRASLKTDCLQTTGFGPVTEYDATRVRYPSLVHLTSPPICS